RSRLPLSAVGALLFLVALLPRLYVALTWGGEPVWDGHYYDFGARRIAEGFGYSDDLSVAGQLVWHPWCHYPVGYSAFLALFYWVFGSGPRVAAIVNACVGALLPVVTWLLARHGLSAKRALVAGLLVALHPGLIVYAALVMSEPLACLLTLVAFYLAVRDGRPARGVVLGALVLGLAALVRPQALLCAPFLGLVGAKSARQLFTGAVIASVVALLPVLPWTARNCQKMDGCALVSTNGGWNLAIGAFPRATGRFETLRSTDGCREVTGQVQQDRCWLAYGIAEIEAHPAHWLGLIPAKLSFTFDHESFPIEYLREARPSMWPEARRVAAREALTFVHRMIVAASVLGCFTLGLRRKGKQAIAQGIAAAVAALLVYAAFASGTPTFWPLVLFVAIVPWLPLPGRPRWSPALLLPVSLVATTVVMHAVFFGEDRYHVVTTPVLCILVAAAFRRPQKSSAAYTPEDVHAA
ncbi:MAG: glycosyltransferase family 39 protein, partial [Polyangiaceae bacterium]